MCFLARKQPQIRGCGLKQHLVLCFLFRSIVFAICTDVCLPIFYVEAEFSILDVNIGVIEIVLTPPPGLPKTEFKDIKDW